MELNQIVVQIYTAPFVRALAQYGADVYQPNQYEIIYDELTDDEKKIWDEFVNMITKKANT